MAGHPHSSDPPSKATLVCISFLFCFLLGSSVIGGGELGRVVTNGSAGSDGRVAFQSSLAQLTWQNITSGAAPQSRQDASIVYDAADGYVLLFGGAAASTGLFRDTWKFSGGVWHKIVSASSPAPSGRWDPSMVYDRADGYVVLFGGDSCYGSCPLSDTWTFQGGHWTNITKTAGTPPTAREGAGMTFDTATGTVVAFGGYRGCYSVCSWAAGWFNDTWTFSNGKWTRDPALGPAPRGEPAMAYDRASGGVIMYGGFAGHGKIRHDTWLLSGGNWTRLSPVAHPNLKDPSMVGLQKGGEVLLLGVENASIGGPSHGSRFATWAFVHGNWTALAPFEIHWARDNPGIVYDRSTRNILLFGGENSACSDFGPCWMIPVFNDTWALS